MPKPICKREASWSIWRYEPFAGNGRDFEKFSKWDKREMRLARRRFERDLVKNMVDLDPAIASKLNEHFLELL